MFSNEHYYFLQRNTEKVQVSNIFTVLNEETKDSFLASQSIQRIQLKKKKFLTKGCFNKAYHLRLCESYLI